MKSASVACPTLLFSELDSTQEFSKRSLGQLPESCVVRAVRQTRGKGRLGRSWISAGARSLTFSVIHPLPQKPVSNIAQVAGLAMARTLSRRGFPVFLKWPNDVLIQGHKVAGILAEMTGGRLILGAGLNLSQEPGFFSGLDQKAASLRQFAPSLNWNAEELLEAFLSVWLPLWGQLCREGFSGLFHDWLSYSQIQGREILLRRFPGATPERVRVQALLPDGQLQVLTGQGTVETLSSGDIELT